MKAVLLLALALSAPAHAQVYKCTVNGTTAYQDAPCPRHAAQQGIDATPAAPGSPEARRQAEARARRDALRSEIVDLERDANRAYSRYEQGTKDRQNRSEQAKCDGYKRELANLETVADKWSSAALRQVDRNRIDELKNRLFSECFRR